MSPDVSEERIRPVFCERIHEKKDGRGSIALSWKSPSGQSSIEWAKKRERTKNWWLVPPYWWVLVLTAGSKVLVQDSRAEETIVEYGCLWFGLGFLRE